MRRSAFALIAVCALAACNAPNPISPQSGGVAGGSTAAAPEGAAPRNFVAHLVGENEVPSRDTAAQGQLVLQLSPDGETLTYRLNAANIHNVVAAHIHVGPIDANGPIVLFLFGPASAGGGRFSGVLGSGTATGGDLTGPLAGQPLGALIAEIDAGNAYVNVHTNDGVAPTNTGAGDFPGGEVRAQVRPLN
jgi:hypothetical protein